MQRRGRAEVLERLRARASRVPRTVLSREPQGRDGREVCLDLPAPLAEALEAVRVLALLLERLDLLLEADEVVEARDLGRGVERGREVEEAGEIECAREAVRLARMLDELDERLVERELACGEVGRREVVPEAVA